MELLQKHFEIALETPAGVEKLRGFILNLAMQGKLVVQDAKDQSAQELLTEIQAERKRIHETLKIKKQNHLPPLKPSEVAYAVPANWKIVRIDEICHDWGQKTPDKKFAYIDVGSIDNRKGAIVPKVQILEKADAPSRARKIVRVGTVIYSTVRPYLMNIAIVDRDFGFEAIASTAFAILHPYSGILNKFIYYYLHSPQFTKYVELKMKGVAYPAINDGDFFKALFPLPPLAEQKRIVVKIDQLMALCDKLEAERNARDQKRITVHTAAMNRLLSAPDKPGFDSSWQFITKHFNELYSVKPNVAELKKAILQLAVMGKLVAQDPNDQPASELLQEIEAEKARLVKEGKIKKSAELPAIKAEEIPCALPQGWEWVRLENYGYLMGGGTPSTNKSVYWDGNVPWVCPKDMKVPYISRTIDAITELAIKESSAKWIPQGSVLFVVRGMILAHTFPVAINSVPVALNQDMKALVPFVSETNEYLLRMLKGFSAQMLSLAEASTHGTRRLEYDKSYGSLPLPLPPLAEQQRIVAKIDQLMALCDALEKQIGAATEKKTAILNAVLAGV